MGLHGGSRESLPGSSAPEATVPFLHGALLPLTASTASLTCDEIGCTWQSIVTAKCELYSNANHSSESLIPVSLMCSCAWRDWHAFLPQSTISKSHSPNKLSFHRCSDIPTYYIVSGSKILSGFNQLRSPKSYYLNEVGISFLSVTVKMNYLPTSK